MAHDWQTCPNLSTEDARQEFHAFRANIKYARGHGVCWVCHIAPAGPSMLHNNPPLELHPYRRVGLMMAWGIFSDLQLKTEAYRDLVESSACPAARKHSWDTVREFAEWIADQDATGEPTSVMAVMSFEVCDRCATGVRPGEVGQNPAWWNGSVRPVCDQCATVCDRVSLGSTLPGQMVDHVATKDES
ncbi:uncharacterized protein SCHCODRAFT_02491781 [Schizophyllum commune H4-8]|uniref:Uncharacterized protein n=1 Tax=Schizophyllum commune (strain H4-8 / FGSC 9210) TaxID=578458 RepID=D8PYD4_SCHCM|nr:uncharacterized protein SCHCODRAFT_02491781 [Schizophyllum commune H4-8]KAI5897287.1 hypothetical protein SCHCODRAFT_02491781 [Schizophyllum commune H4-8]